MVFDCINSCSLLSFLLQHFYFSELSKNIIIGSACNTSTKFLNYLYLSKQYRLAPVLKTFFHPCVISNTCSQSYSDGPVLRSLKQSHQIKNGYKDMM